MKSNSENHNLSQVFRDAMQVSADTKMQITREKLMEGMVQAGLPTSQQLAVMESFQKQSQMIQGIKEWSIRQILIKTVQSIILIVLIGIFSKLWRTETDFINSSLVSILPEDWLSDFATQRERWIKKNFSQRQIKYLTFRYLLDMFWGYLKIKIENIWLSNDNTTNKFD